MKELFMKEDFWWILLIFFFCYLGIHYGLFILKRDIFLNDKKYEGLRVMFSPLPPLLSLWILRVILIVGSLFILTAVLYKIILDYSS
ncbi:hypothetical protein ACFVR2_19545 [Gottfriedia sp. NPDC057991]|uniref:hypothetical protein n=1 Tax=Gottfriedia sp. NPDC057991 TaxID=3346298 RepID=UPI0036DF773E